MGTKPELRFEFIQERAEFADEAALDVLGRAIANSAPPLSPLNGRPADIQKAALRASTCGRGERFAS